MRRPFYKFVSGALVVLYGIVLYYIVLSVNAKMQPLRSTEFVLWIQLVILRSFISCDIPCWVLYDSLRIVCARGYL